MAALALLLATLPGRLPVTMAAAAAPAPTVAARAAVLYDPVGQAFLGTERPDLELPVASLTKLMTAYLALHEPGSTPVKAGPDAAAMPQTTAGLIAGRTYTLGSLLPLLIVRSANDVAVAVADALAGSVPAFAADMNAEAAALGLSDTHYVNPDGLDAAGQHSSARDVAVLAGLDVQMPAFAQLAAMRTATLPGGATFGDENPFLGAYPGSDGVKTGFTSTAGFCLAASATRGGRRLIAVVLDEPSWAKAVADASALLNWGFSQPQPAASAHPVAATMIPLTVPPAAQPPPAESAAPAPAPAAATGSTATAAPAATTAAAGAATMSAAAAPTTPAAAAAATVASANATGAAGAPHAATGAVPQTTARSRQPAGPPPPTRTQAAHPQPAWLALGAIALLGLAALVVVRGSRPGA